MKNGDILYDDAVMVAKSWEELEAREYDLTEVREKRSEALRRLRARKVE